MPDPYDPVPTREGFVNYYAGIPLLLTGGSALRFLRIGNLRSPLGLLAFPQKQARKEVRIDFSKINWKKYENLDLLGKKQERFFKEWGEDWTGAKMKVVVSQTIYVSASTDRAGKGMLGIDSDSNGFPKPGRDRAVDLFRRTRALVICRDQHLGTVTQLGIEKPRDGVYEFSAPAVGNIFWRYFYPASPGDNRAPGAPEYTGDLVDGFGNYFRMAAAANPQDLDVYRKGIPRGSDLPEETRDGIRYCKGDGYGIVRLDKRGQKMRIECWPFNVMPPSAGSGRGQFVGWPIGLKLEELDGRKSSFFLPDLVIEGLQDPVVQVIAQETGDVIYAKRTRDGFYRPGVFSPGVFTIKIGEPGTNRNEIIKDLTAGTKRGEKNLRISFK